MPEIAAHGLHVDAPTGWEARIFRRAEQGEVNVEVAGAAAPPGERTFPVVHVATVLLPMDMADYGSDVVEDLRRDDALVVLKEFDPESATQPLFKREGMPRKLAPRDFDPGTVQRRLEPQAGYQAFFQEGGRTFCLYVVLGDFGRREHAVPVVNEVLATIVIDPMEPIEELPETTEPTTTTTAPEETDPTEPTEPTEPPTTPTTVEESTTTTSPDAP
jgi:hypothetical protein